MDYWVSHVEADDYDYFDVEGGWNDDFEGNAVLDNDAVYLVNPGSVGQPRDGNSAASFVLFDSENQSLQFYRVPYDVEANLKKAKRHQLLRDPFIKSVAKRACRKASKLVKAL